MNVCCSGCQDKKEIVNPGPPVSTKSEIAVWLTKLDGTVKFQKQSIGPKASEGTNSNPIINIDTTLRYQSMDGFGYSLTGGSAILLNQMGATQRKALLDELFKYDYNNIGTSYLRISIGASDLDPTVFSYNDLPAGQTDLEMTQFSLAKDKENLIPMLKEILAINPNIKIMGSPWSPPTWMKTNNNSKGGSLKPEYYAAYAKYFVKYVQGMAAEGITIDAITVQNEPLHPGNNPSLLMYAADQAVFIKNHLGPAFEAAGLNTKIIVYDHNADRTDYPLEILNDAGANQYVDGSAFHLYGGSIGALEALHNAHPDKNLYFTEQWVGVNSTFQDNLGWHTKELIIGASRNWCKTVLEWNLASDPNQDPHTDGGCTECLGAVTIDGSSFTRNSAYYIIAHAAKFARPGSVRVSSNMPAELPNVVFHAPNGDKVMVVRNESGNAKNFNISYNGKVFEATLEGNSVATYIW